MASGLIGIENVMKNLNKEMGKLKVRSSKGLLKAAILIRRDMDKTPPLIPVDISNLRASWYIVTAISTDTGADFKQGKIGGKKADVAGLSSQHSKVVATAASKAKAVGRPLVIMGFSAIYSGFIHESKSAKNFNRPGSGTKFFESSLRRNTPMVIKIVAIEGRIR